MTKRTERKQSSRTIRGRADEPSVSALEKRVIEMAEQLGRLAGSAQAKTDDWLDQPTFKEQLNRVRLSAADLLKNLSAHIPGDRAASRPPSAKAAKGRSGGTVDAPGKKHRKAPKAVRGVKHSDQKITKAITASRMKRGKARQG